MAQWAFVQSHCILVRSKCHPLSSLFPFNVHESGSGENRTLSSGGEVFRRRKCEQLPLRSCSYELYKCSRSYYELSVALRKNFPNFTGALSADGLLRLSSHSAWLPANASVWQLPMVFLTCIYLSEIRGSWAILGRQQLANSLFSNL